MKKIKYLLMILLVAVVMPFAVKAEDGAEETTSTNDSKEVSIYFFRGEGCPHCEEAEEWFKSIESEYGNMFEIVDYETWYNEDNAALMKEVAEKRNESADGVPYIIIGDKSWNGFDTSYEEEIISEIKTLYEQPVSDRPDAIKGVAGKTDKEKKSVGPDILALIVIIAVVGLGGFGIYKARNSSK